MKTIILSLLFSANLMAQSISVAPNLSMLHGDEYTNMYTIPKIGAQIGFGKEIKLSQTFAIQYDAIASFNRFGVNIQIRDAQTGKVVTGYIRENRYQVSLALPIQLRIKAAKGVSFGLGGVASYGMVSSENVLPLNLGAIGSVYYKSLFIQANYGLIRIDRYRFNNLSSISCGIRFKI
jgi:hypothetical protein